MVLEMHLQETHYLTFELGVKVAQNVAKCPLHNVNYAPAKFEVANTTSNSLGEDAFTRKYIIPPLTIMRVKVIQNVAQYLYIM